MEFCGAPGAPYPIETVLHLLGKDCQMNSTIQKTDEFYFVILAEVTLALI
jgi:hypothetical protein